MKRWLLIPCALLGGILLWQVCRGLFITDEKLVRNLITTMQHAVERNKILALNDCIAADYTDEHSLDKSSLLGAIRGVRSQYDIMLIRLSDLKLEVNAPDKTAQAAFTVNVVAHRAGGGGETTMDADRVRLFFRKTDDGWKLSRAEYPEMDFK